MKKNTTFEVCPFCEEEVELNAELMVQTCPHCGKRIVACSMCRASEDTEHNYCTHCCLDYQARVENQEAERETEFKTQVLHEQAPLTDITKYIKPGVSLYDVICHWTADRGGEEEFALFDLEDPDDAELFMKARGIHKYLDCRDLNRYWFDGLNDRFGDGPEMATEAEMVRLINTEVLDRVREEYERGDDIAHLWDQVFDMDGDVWDQVLGIRPENQDKPELAEKPKEPFIVMTREMSLLGETIQDITLSAWPIVWDNNKYDQDSREVLEMLRDWAVEFENWWYGHDQDWRDANCWSIEVEDYTIRKSKEYVKELQERISK